MSSKVTFQIVHGEGNIRFGPDGVDLSDFVMTSKGIDRPAERTFQSIYSWLLRGFRIDQEVYTMSVSVVVSRAIEEGDHVPWEYKEYEVIEGARYAHKDEMKEAVKHWAVSLQREFRVVKSTNYVYEVRCMKEDCPWRVHAYKGKWNDYWKVSIVTEHKCYLQGVEKYHRNITSAFVASEMYSSVVGNIGFEPKSIIRHIENKFKYTISYAKAWRAKQKIIEMRYGTFEACYDNLPRLLATIAQRNNNTYYDLHTFTSVEDRTKSVLQRAFFSLGACINAFVHCRPVLCIDGTFMTGKYRGQILTAIGCDGNNQVLPMAFAFVESENTESWYWFLERVHIAVNGWDEKGLPAKWPDVRSRWCMRHMGANFYKQFKNKHLMELFKRLCAQNQEKKFNELWDKLDELTRKQTDEQSRRPQVEGDEPPIPLGALHDDPPTMRRRSGSAIRNFSQWIENEPKEKWALLFDTDGSRYGIMTTNLAEVYNWVMRGVRVLPLVAIVEFILHGTQAYFRDRYKKIGPSMADNNIVFGNVVTKYMEDKIKKARRHRVVAQGTQVHRYEIMCVDRSRRGIYRKQAVQECVLKADGGCTYSCMKPKLHHLPCSHVLAAAGDCGISPNVYVSNYFRKEAIFHTWSEEIYGFGISGSYTTLSAQVFYIPDPSKFRVKKGRRQTRRIRNDMDESEAGGRTLRCSKCDLRGHTYKTCPKNAEVPSGADASPSGQASDGEDACGHARLLLSQRRGRRTSSWSAGFAAGIFGTGASSSHAGRTGPTSQFYDDDLHGADHQDVLGSSQLGGAPEAHTQEQPEVTPVQAGRVGRAVPPDRLTYSPGHIRAQGRRDRVLFIRMVLEQLMLTTTHFRRFTVVPYPVARTVHNSTHEKRQLELSLSTFGAAC
uniref:OSJNBb0060E08.10 protein n=1 Tax=Oryza sativa subsp. japonica TaxID=39947 RepID=Q7XM89_ORYSJ|nr:OSJNBb0060E08.10 [Oryza sativa Japonica Group]